MQKVACKLIVVDSCNNCPFYLNLHSLDVYPPHYCEKLKRSLNLTEFPSPEECPLPDSEPS